MSDQEHGVRRTSEVTRRIREFIEAARDLPSPRGVALRVIELSRDPEVGIAEIGHVVKGDPALAGRLLHAANAARFAHLPKVADISQALSRLGLTTVKTLAVATSVIDSTSRPACPGFDYDGFWGHSLFSAIALSKIAKNALVKGEEAFALGLLAQVGQLALATATPEAYGRILAEAEGKVETQYLMERQTFDFDRDEFSAVLLADWGMPTRFTEVVFCRRDPESRGFGWSSAEYRLATELQLAETLADVCLGSSELANAKLAPLYWQAKRMSVDQETLGQIAATVSEEWASWAAELGIASRRIAPLPKMPGA